MCFCRFSIWRRSWSSFCDRPIVLRASLCMIESMLDHSFFSLVVVFNLSDAVVVVFDCCLVLEGDSAEVRVESEVGELVGLDPLSSAKIVLR